MGYDWISFTTDYGLADGFVAACEGVVARIAPAARVLHVSHAVPAQDVRRGSAVLAQTVPHLPPAVHLAVVDPGVGTERRPVLLVAEGAVFVGPDNGLLVPAAEQLGLLGAHELTAAAYRLSPMSATFHGRDVFAPAAAHLARGVPPAEFGPALDPAELCRLPAPRTGVAPGKLLTEVLGTDVFGNVQLAATGADLAAAGGVPGGVAQVHVGGRSARAAVGRTFADVPPGAYLVYVDSADRVSVAVNGGSASPDLGGAAGTPASLEFPAG